jgi:eukaryotic-like serine/threonine-protein kinase
MARIGKYEILGEIGSGGMAVVYKARDTLLERFVALKLINQKLDESETAYQRFLNEARVAAGLTHPNIVSIYELGLDEGRPYIAMEFLQGWDLRELIARHQELGLRQKVSIALQIARALEHAHKHGVIHRDVKPANIRLLPDGTVKLMDFGIAKILSDALPQLTRSGVVVGTVSYMSPEQLRSRPLGPASDIFSFGVVLYELLTWTNPFEAPNPTAIIYRIIHESPPPIEDPAIPEDLRRVVAKCLEKSPEDRYPTFEPLVQQLLRIKARLRKPVAPPPEPDAETVDVPPEGEGSASAETTAELQEASEKAHASLRVRGKKPGAAKPSPRLARQAGEEPGPASGEEPPAKSLPIGALALSLGLLGLSALGVLVLLLRSPGGGPGPVGPTPGPTSGNEGEIPAVVSVLWPSQTPAPPELPSPLAATRTPAAVLPPGPTRTEAAAPSELPAESATSTPSLPPSPTRTVPPSATPTQPPPTRTPPPLPTETVPPSATPTQPPPTRTPPPLPTETVPPSATPPPTRTPPPLPTETVPPSATPTPPPTQTPPPSATPRPTRTPPPRPTPAPTRTPRPRPKPRPTEVDADLGTLVLVVKPEGAFVQIDGRGPEMLTPLDPIPLHSGVHFLSIYRDGYLPQQPIFDIEAGESFTLRITLEPAQ